MTILQWNINGLYIHRNDLQYIINNNDCYVVALQETHLKPSNKFHIKGYSFVNKDYVEGKIACGGVGILIKNCIPYNVIDLNTPLQAVAVRLEAPIPLTVISLYLPPAKPFLIQDLNDLCNNVPSPVLILGDFNSHNELWGSNHTDSRGKTIENFINYNDLNILNENDIPTYVSPHSGSTSIIDLSIGSPILNLKLTWKALED